MNEITGRTPDGNSGSPMSALAAQDGCADVDLFTKLGNGFEGALYGFAAGAGVWLVYYLYTELAKGKKK
jgi:hypothetical protein